MVGKRAKILSPDHVEDFSQNKRLTKFEHLFSFISWTGVQNLATAVSAVAGAAPIVLVASPAQAIALRLYLGRDTGFEILASSALSAGIVVAIASNCIASACDPLPRFEVSDKAVLHMATDAHDNIDTDAVAETVISTFQSDRIALKLIMEVSWGLRVAAGLAWTTVTW